MRNCPADFVRISMRELMPGREDCMPKPEDEDELRICDDFLRLNETGPPPDLLGSDEFWYGASTFELGTRWGHGGLRVPSPPRKYKEVDSMYY
jgi:hypothetical protein